MLKQMLEDLCELFAWARSNMPGLIEYTSEISLMLFNTTVCLLAPFSLTLIAYCLWPEWGSVSLIANIIALVVLAWVVNAYERSRA